jgi:hypothetical protein
LPPGNRSLAERTTNNAKHFMRIGFFLVAATVT